MGVLNCTARKRLKNAFYKRESKRKEKCIYSQKKHNYQRRFRAISGLIFRCENTATTRVRFKIEKYPDRRNSSVKFKNFTKKKNHPFETSTDMIPAKGLKLNGCTRQATGLINPRFGI